jgi:hypothetical protein
MPLGEIGTVVGLIIAMPGGAFVYRRVHARLAPRRRSRIIAGFAGGLVTALLASAVFIPTRVHVWLGGYDWRSSVFLAVCFGIIQGALLKENPDILASYRAGKARARQAS